MAKGRRRGGLKSSNDESIYRRRHVKLVEDDCFTGGNYRALFLLRKVELYLFISFCCLLKIEIINLILVILFFIN